MFGLKRRRGSGGWGNLGTSTNSSNILNLFKSASLLNLQVFHFSTSPLNLMFPQWTPVI
jgi:hypothetical protein